MTGRNEAYYTDYKGTAQEFVATAKWGFLYQGQRYKWQKNRRGTPALDRSASNFVNFIQNHDQIANSLWGRRIHTLTSVGRFRAFTALLLLGPGTPMLFQGQEYAASTPFLYFADHDPELAKVVAAGRAEFLKQFPSIASSDVATFLPDPQLEETFTSCKLDSEDRDKNANLLKLHRDLIALRKADPIIGKTSRGSFDGAVLDPSAFVLRFFGRDKGDRLLVVNFGQQLHLDPAPEPLLAPPEGQRWQLAWSSEDPIYGGNGTPPIESEENWNVPADSAVLLVPTTETV
jgi:maltooligosyltrehalose trehalohydrolase